MPSFYHRRIARRVSVCTRITHKDYTKNNIKCNNELKKIAQDALREKKVKSFQSNRFGRIGELSEAITEQKILIEVFFDEQVNENQNKLVLAVAAYIQSDWFLLCGDFLL